MINGTMNSSSVVTVSNPSAKDRELEERIMMCRNDLDCVPSPHIVELNLLIKKCDEIINLLRNTKSGGLLGHIFSLCSPIIDFPDSKSYTKCIEDLRKCIENLQPEFLNICRVNSRKLFSFSFLNQITAELKQYLPITRFESNNIIKQLNRKSEVIQYLPKLLAPNEFNKIIKQLIKGFKVLKTACQIEKDEKICLKSNSSELKDFSFEEAAKLYETKRAIAASLVESSIVQSNCSSLSGVSFFSRADSNKEAEISSLFTFATKTCLR